MRSIVSVLDRLVQAVLMAASVTLLTAGLLSFAPSTFGDWQTPEPSVVAGDPLLTVAPGTSPSESPTSPPPGLSFSLAPGATPTQIATPTATGTPEPTPTGGLGPTGTPDYPNRGYATRIRIPSLGIDLPIVSGDLIVPGNRDFYPLCDVAMFMPQFVQPGESGATYIYAHAQRGMFAPLLRSSQLDNGSGMVGALIEVYTSDNKLHVYELYQVKRHATDLSLASPAPGEHMLVLQTSEGPSGTVPKLQVAARPLSVVPADLGEANPPANPRVCLP
ncbi:MAG TPA: sortase [Candidatus Limnocylindrales bacterium]|nr:sortase [Candidatus Limnocylindrales bacterium]